MPSGAARAVSPFEVRGSVTPPGPAARRVLRSRVVSPDARRLAADGAPMVSVASASSCAVHMPQQQGPVTSKQWATPPRGGMMVAAPVASSSVVAVPQPQRAARSLSPWAGSLRGPAGVASVVTPCGSAAGSFVAPPGGSNAGSFRVGLPATRGSIRPGSPLAGCQTPPGALTPPPVLCVPLHIGSGRGDVATKQLLPAAGARAPAQERVGRRSVSPFGRGRADAAPSKSRRDSDKAPEETIGPKAVPTLVLPVGKHALQPVPSFTPDAGEVSCEDTRSVTDSCLTAENRPSQRSRENTSRSFPTGRDQRSVSFGKTTGDSPPEHSERTLREAADRQPWPTSADAAAGGGGDMSSAASEVLRQHLERRRNQLHSMQQRLAHIGAECDGIRGAAAIE